MFVHSISSSCPVPTLQTTFGAASTDENIPTADSSTASSLSASGSARSDIGLLLALGGNASASLSHDSEEADFDSVVAASPAPGVSPAPTLRASASRSGSGSGGILKKSNGTGNGSGGWLFRSSSSGNGHADDAPNPSSASLSMALSVGRLSSATNQSHRSGKLKPPSVHIPKKKPVMVAIHFSRLKNLRPNQSLPRDRDSKDNSANNSAVSSRNSLVALRDAIGSGPAVLPVPQSGPILGPPQSLNAVPSSTLSQNLLSEEELEDSRTVYNSAAVGPHRRSDGSSQDNARNVADRNESDIELELGFEMDKF